MNELYLVKCALEVLAVIMLAFFCYWVYLELNRELQDIQKKLDATISKYDQFKFISREDK